MKSVVLGRQGDQVRWNPRFLDFASYYSFLPRACHPYRPETKGKIERTIEFLRGNFWPGLSFTSLEDLNRQAWVWMEEINHHPHRTTREVPYERRLRENLRPLSGQTDYDTSYVSYRQVAKDCLVSYRGNHYSVPHAYAGKAVVVKEPVGAGLIRLCHQEQTIAEHRLAFGKGAIVIQDQHYRGLVRRPRGRPPSPPPLRELIAGPGVGRHFAVPEVEVRSLAAYEEVNHVAAI
jgi:Mu transposase, C-terminal domain